MRTSRSADSMRAVESSPNIFIGKIADAQRAVDDAKTKAEELEQEKTELDNQVDMFRQKVMSKLDGAE